MANELKPCPFCGGSKLETYYCDIEGWIAHIKCLECDDMIGPMSDYKYEAQEEAFEDAAAKWNNRPAAPVEGLETKAWYHPYKAVTLDEAMATRWMVGPPDLKIEELVTRSQAEAIIAVERARSIGLAHELAVSNQKRRDLEADNAALTARVKELVTALDQQLGTPCEQISHSQQVEALETQLAATRKALEWYEEHVSNCRKIGSIGAPSRAKLDRDGGEKARAALEAQS